ncbi:hypothetical protein [Roseomonas sp. KE2513]|uniref:hypothetical protein n=1 Tax=Roseomonas sp. KE2513 TaxID=2479202 RepID=UPI0018E01B8F|nr:hypothetical protein [Roseomonas sp. KE2513]
MKFIPYADEAATMRLDGMMVENRLDRVSLYGSLDLTRDRAGLESARRLQSLLQAAIAVLEGEGERLPQRVVTGEGNDTVRNPFG